MITHDLLPLADRCLSRCSPHTSIMDINHIQEEHADIYMCASLSGDIYCGLHFAKNSTYLTAILFCLSCEVKGHKRKFSNETKGR